MLRFHACERPAQVSGGVVTWSLVVCGDVVTCLLVSWLIRHYYATTIGDHLGVFFKEFHDYKLNIVFLEMQNGFCSKM